MKNKHNVSLNIRGSDLKKATGSILTSKNVQDHNTFDQPNKLSPTSFTDFKFSKETLSLDIPPFSVVVIELD